MFANMQIIRAFLIPICIFCIETASAQPDPETIFSHGLSAFGDLKYPADFPHFDYVNVNAPKGGELRHNGVRDTKTFDSLNAFILLGDYPEGMLLENSDVGGEVGSLVFDSLMAIAGDEPDSVYGLVAWQVEYPSDRSWVIFRLRPEAHFHDGTPLTAEDVKFSLELLKEEGNPRLSVPLKDVERIEQLSDYEIKVTFKEGVLTRDLPTKVGLFPIFSKVYYTANDFSKSTLDRPLGSGPYRVGQFKQGRWIEYERVPDYWAKDLPVNRGRWNFDKIRFEFYRDRNIDFEAFKSNQYDLREEFTSKTWVTEYDFPAHLDGRVVKRLLRDSNPSGDQGYHINTRRKKFADVHTRKALDYAFDFEWTNKTIMFDQYQRTTSHFANSTDLSAEGKPKPDELALLEPHRDVLPPEVFDEAYVSPTTDGNGRNRANLRMAVSLLQEAGWQVVDGMMVDKAGSPLTIEFLDYDTSILRITGPFVENLKSIGVDANMRVVDPPQYERRKKEFDFDIIVMRTAEQNTPSFELRNYFGSTYANEVGAWNFSGISDPVVDDLIEKAIKAESRAELTAATRALDRVLRVGHYWVPHWYSSFYRMAYWDQFGYPDTQPLYQRGVLDTWWSKDAESAPSN